MVPNSIKVFARVKQEPGKIRTYKICKCSKCEVIEFKGRKNPNNPLSKPIHYMFRFHKVFDQISTQQEVFAQIAMPVVNSVIHGFNGTIFAYGQTGSGKTYTITGSPKEYDNRGIIPRCVQHIFEYINQQTEECSVHISYLEIYNEVGYDLLNPKQHASKIEDLPRVILLEDSKGHSHLRNLTIHPISTEKEAMRLLFLGDTNRTISETQMNECSSRSHCIFTIYFSVRLQGGSKRRKSKLHLVDLAGSERIYKSNITGLTLHEAKNINLSLHYLEQVISALSKSRKSHIPYRNSMLTFMLRDSLAGNCLTTMIATLALSHRNIEETISTCKFAKRVSLLSTEPIINEESDTENEIQHLRNEVITLREKIASLETTEYINSDECPDRFMSIEEQKTYTEAVMNYINTPGAALDVETVHGLKFCMEILKREYIHCKNRTATFSRTSSPCRTSAVVESSEERLKHGEIQLKELLKMNATDHTKENTQKAVLSKEIQTFPDGFLKDSEKFPRDLRPNSAPIIVSPKDDFVKLARTIDRKYPISNLHHASRSAPAEKSETDKFKNEIEDYKEILKQKYQKAKLYMEAIETCKMKIMNIKTRLEGMTSNDLNRAELNAKLLHYQDIYRGTIIGLRQIESETDHLNYGLQQLEVKCKKQQNFNCAKTQTRIPEPYVTSTFAKNLTHKNWEYQNLDPDPGEGIAKTTNQPVESQEYPSTSLNSNPYGLADQIKMSPKLRSIEENKTLGKAHDFSDSNSEETAFTEKLEYSDEGDKSSSTWSSGNESQEDLLEEVPLDAQFEILKNKENHSSDDKKKEFRPLSSDPVQKNLIEDDFSFFGDTPYGNPSVGCKYGLFRPHRLLSPVEELDVDDSEGQGDTVSVSCPNVNSEEEKQEIDKSLFRESDTKEFRDFMGTIPLTGDYEVDEEIFKFYRSKFNNM